MPENEFIWWILMETLRVTKSQNRYRIYRMLCSMTYMEAIMNGMFSSWTLFFHFPEPWKRDFEEQKTADFKGNVRFLLLCVLKRSLSVVFAIMCRYILLRNRGIWLYIVRVVKYYGRHNVYTGIFYYDTLIWQIG